MNLKEFVFEFVLIKLCRLREFFYILGFIINSKIFVYCDKVL